MVLVLCARPHLIAPLILREYMTGPDRVPVLGAQLLPQLCDGLIVGAVDAPSAGGVSNAHDHGVLGLMRQF